MSEVRWREGQENEGRSYICQRERERNVGEGNSDLRGESTDDKRTVQYSSHSIAETKESDTAQMDNSGRITEFQHQTS